MQYWYLDFEEKNQMWHIDTNRVPENEYWSNIGYGSNRALDHFCNVIDMMRREFGIRFTTEQIIRLAECTPGIILYNPTPMPEDDIDADRHSIPIYSRDRIDQHIDWEAIETQDR